MNILGSFKAGMRVATLKSSLTSSGLIVPWDFKLLTDLQICLPTLKAHLLVEHHFLCYALMFWIWANPSRSTAKATTSEQKLNCFVLLSCILSQPLWRALSYISCSLITLLTFWIITSTLVPLYSLSCCQKEDPSAGRMPAGCPSHQAGPVVHQEPLIFHHHNTNFQPPSEHGFLGSGLDKIESKIHIMTICMYINLTDNEIFYTILSNFPVFL